MQPMQEKFNSVISGTYLEKQIKEEIEWLEGFNCPSQCERLSLIDLDV